MWLFPWNPNSDLYSHYDIGDQVVSYNDKSIWTLFKAKKKGTNEHLSVFRFDLKDSNSPMIEFAKQSLKRIKTLRHPSILKYVHSSETEKSICIVTESVTPLAEYLDEKLDEFTSTQKEFAIAYGLLSVAKGLHFINNDCQLNHNNIHIHSIFVNSSGVWKIGGLEHISSFEDQPPIRYDQVEIYTPPERLDPCKVKHPGQKYAVDSWGLGCLVWESFNKPLTPTSCLKKVGKMPKPMSLHYNKLVQSSPRHRVSPMDFIKECREANIFFNTSPIETILFLEEIQLVEDLKEKATFFSRLENELESFPPDICKNKILPELINAFDYGEAGSAILDPIFKIGKMLNQEEYQTRLVPCIIKLYACKDRSTRSKLLAQLDCYLEYLTANVINDQIFPQVVQGFLDSNFKIKEQTIKSILHLAPKLNHTNLNEELLKHFQRLLACDEEGGIRANSTVCLGKIAKLFNGHTQQTSLLPTFFRVLRDPFPPARNAAIAGISANESLFSTKDIATRIMPALCPMCVDPDVTVRKLSFKAIRLFLDRVESKSDSDAQSVLEPHAPSAAAIRQDMKSLTIKD